MDFQVPQESCHRHKLFSSPWQQSCIPSGARSVRASTSAKGVERQDFAIQALGKQVSIMLYFVHLGFYNLLYVLGLRPDYRLSVVIRGE